MARIKADDMALNGGGGAMSRLKKTMSGHSWREFLKVCGTWPGRHSGRTIDTARGRGHVPR